VQNFSGDPTFGNTFLCPPVHQNQKGGFPGEKTPQGLKSPLKEKSSMPNNSEPKPLGDLHQKKIGVP